MNTRSKPVFIVFCITLLTACGGGSLLSGGSSGNLSFDIQGENAIMTGEIGSNTARELQELVDENPDVRNIVMLNVPGSNDDEAAIPAYDIIRSNGLNTSVPSNGVIASGGVDFFVAGTRRSIQNGAMLGVHAWTDGETSAAELPRDHPSHSLFIDYYRRMGLPDPEGFYFFTINAAPPEGIHYMTVEEMNRFGLLN